MKYKIFDTVQISKKSVEGDAIRVSVIASTARIDRNGERVEQKYDLSDYSKNPVLLWNHARDKNINFLAGLPIGYTENHRVDGGKFYCDLVFASAKANPLAPLIANSFVEKSIRAVSIGFDYGNKTETEENGQSIKVLSGIKIVEISACVIGVNPDAVMIALKSYETTKKKAENMKMTPEELAQFLAQLAALVGLTPEATPEEILAAVSDKCGAPASQVMEAVGAETMQEAAAKVCSLKLVADAAIEQAKAQKSHEPNRIEQKIKHAIDKGILLPSTAKSVREYAAKYGEKALDDHLAMIGKSFAIAPTSTPKVSDEQAPKLKAFELEMLSQMGMTEEQFLKYGAR